MSKVWQLLKNMTKKFIFYVFKIVIIICIHWLNLKGGVVDERVENEKSLDIFEIIISINEPTMELVNRDLLIFKCYQLDVKDITCPL